MANTKEIIAFLHSENISFSYYGENDLEIKSFSSIEAISDNSILWIKNSQMFSKMNLAGYKDLLIVADKLYDNLNNVNFLVADNSKAVFFSLLSRFFVQEEQNVTIAETSVIETTELGENVAIGHYCYVGPDVVLGDNVVIKNCVSLENKVIVGNNTTIFSGVIIGSDGYGYYQDAKGNNIKVPHFGGVIIGDNVEIGANTCIDRGTLGDTKIGNNVKIDNLCHIAHNVVIENDVSMTSNSTIAGSVVLERNSYIAPSASVMNQLTVGQNSVVGIGAVVVKNVEENVVVAGMPARVIRKRN